MRRVEAGKSFVIMRIGKAIADLVPHGPSAKKRKTGRDMREDFRQLPPIVVEQWYRDRADADEFFGSARIEYEARRLTRSTTRPDRRSSMLCRVARWEDLLRQAAQAGLRLLTRERRPGSPARPRAEGRARTAPARDRARRIVYAPDLDGAADPGEIVWTWVPYEEADGRGKDRPVLVVGRNRSELLGLMLSSQADHADDRDWVGIGSGRWDARGRASYVRMDRVIEVGEREIRREGAVLDEARFDRVADALRSRYGWT